LNVCANLRTVRSFARYALEMAEVNNVPHSQGTLQIAELSIGVLELAFREYHPPVELEGAASGTEELAWSAPTPAAGRFGSVTSMYAAPAEPGAASTVSAAVHFADSSVAGPK
jgi:hypothetical protein